MEQEETYQNLIMGPHIGPENHDKCQTVVKCKTVRQRDLTNFHVGLFWERRAGEMTFSRGAERGIHHLRPFGILVPRPVPKLEESRIRDVLPASQRCNFGVKDDNV